MYKILIMGLFMACYWQAMSAQNNIETTFSSTFAGANTTITVGEPLHLNSSNLNIGFLYGDASNSTMFTLFTNDRTVLVGDTIFVAVRIKNIPTDGLGSLQEIIEYDTSKLEYLGTNVAISGFLSSSITPGEINIVYASPTGQGQNFTDSTVLVNLQFAVNMNLGENTSFSLGGGTAAGVWDGQASSVPYTSNFGQITVVNAVNISGEVYTEFFNPVPNATVLMTGDLNAQSTTDGIGAYNFQIASGSNVDITPERYTTVYTGVDVLDQFLIQLHILGIQLLGSPYKIIAADVNQDGVVNALDLYLITQLILGINTDFYGEQFFFVNHDHTFSDPLNPFPFPSMRSYTNLQQATDQDYICGTLGDVNNSDVYQRIISNNDSAYIEIDTVEVLENGEAIVEFRAYNFDSIIGIQMTVSITDSFIATIDSAIQASLAVTFGAELQGKRTVSAFSSNGQPIHIPNGMVLFKLKLKALGTSGTQTAISLDSSITPFIVYNANLNSMNVMVRNGLFKITSPSGYINTAPPFEVSVFPNPFNQVFTTKVKLPSPSELEFELCNELGQILYRQNLDIKTDNYLLQLNAVELGLSPGFYTLRIYSEHGNVWKKLVYFE